MKLSEELKARGFINQFSGESLEEIVDGEKRTFYLGVDPTADSIHIGNLTVYMMMRHIADAGHKIILLVGGGTGLLGDPRETEERALSDMEKVNERAQKLSKQVSGLLDTEVEVVNNADWLTKLSLIEFMRDIGKLLTVNQMIKKEIIAKRLENESPISYTEFAYAPMQGYDFLHLYENHNCTVQVGGSDQWGNMMTGVEIIRKKIGGEAFVLTAPLIVDKATGRKFGKSEGNAIWLNADMTSPYQLYQFWLNVSDEDVVDRLKIFTLLSLEEIEKLAHESKENPGARIGQKALAYEVTTFVHGEESASASKKVSEILFGGSIDEVSDVEKEMLLKEAPSYTMQNVKKITELLVETKLATSKSDARKLIEGNAVSVDGEKITDTEQEINLKNDISILRKGKKGLVVLYV